MVKFFRTLSIPQALVLLGLIAGVVAMWALTPAKLVDKLAEQSPETLAAGIVTIGIAVAGVFARFRSGPALALLGVLALGGTLTGCGGPIQAQSQAIRATVVGLDVASDLAETWATADMQRCEDVPCVDAVEARWAPVAAGQLGVLAALATWTAGLSLYMAAESKTVARWMVRAARDVIAAWQVMDAAATALGHNLPDVPPVVLGIVDSLGGEQ